MDRKRPILKMALGSIRFWKKKIPESKRGPLFLSLGA